MNNYESELKKLYNYYFNELRPFIIEIETNLNLFPQKTLIQIFNFDDNITELFNDNNEDSNYYLIKAEEFIDNGIIESLEVLCFAPIQDINKFKKDFGNFNLKKLDFYKDYKNSYDLFQKQLKVASELKQKKGDLKKIISEFKKAYESLKNTINILKENGFSIAESASGERKIIFNRIIKYVTLSLTFVISLTLSIIFQYLFS